jgi:hypothetical protein
MAERHAELYSSFVQLQELQYLRTKEEGKWSKATRKNIFQREAE